MIKPDNFVTSQSLFILDEALNLIVQIRRLVLNKNPFYKRLNTCVYRDLPESQRSSKQCHNHKEIRAEVKFWQKKGL